jgi:hypothetical protein
VLLQQMAELVVQPQETRLAGLAGGSSTAHNALKTPVKKSIRHSPPTSGLTRADWPIRFSPDGRELGQQR